MSVLDNRFASQKNLEEALKNDDLFLEYFNAYLALPIFPKRNLVTNEVVEEIICKLVGIEKSSTCGEKQIKYCVKFLEKESGFKWIMSHRLPLFLQSTLFADYKLAKLLFAEQKIIVQKIGMGFSPKSQVWLAHKKTTLLSSGTCNNPSDHKVTSNGFNIFSKKQFLDAFKAFLYKTPGENLILLWIDIESSKHLSQFQQFRCFQSIKDCFFSSGAPYKIPNEILTSWKVENISSFDDLILILEMVLNPILKYWLPRFIFHCLQGIRTNDEIYLSNSFSFQLGLVSSLNPCKSKDERSAEEQNFYAYQSGIKSAYSMYTIQEIPNMHNVNSEKLQSISCSQSVFGLKPQNMFSYHNDATDFAYYNQFRLFLPAIPPLKLNASILKSVSSENINNMLFNAQTKKSNIVWLIEMLLCEKLTGHYFLNYLEKENNALWINCYFFWKSVQQYHDYFFSISFSPQAVKRKANSIYTMFICPKSEFDLKLSEETNRCIYDQLDPPYEDLFDSVEKDALFVLLRPFLNLIERENHEYGMLNIHERFEYIKSECPAILKDKNNQNSTTAKVTKSLFGSGKKDNESMDKRKKDAVNEDFIRLLENENSRKKFRIFLEKNYKLGLMDLMAYLDMQDYINASDSEKENWAICISQKWFNEAYFLGSNSPASPEVQQNIFSHNGKVCKHICEIPNALVISEAQKYVRLRLEHVYFKMFMNECSRNQKVLTSQQTNQDSIQNNAIKKKLKQSKIRNQQETMAWNENSYEVRDFRHALNEPDVCSLFKQFLNNNYLELEKNLDFWIEVQKYKYLCHRHVDDQIIEDKLQAIIDVFICSSIPPTLRIDIAAEVADELLQNRRLKKTQPYVFREAQAEVFRSLFSAWTDFNMYRMSFGSDFQKTFLSKPKNFNKTKDSIEVKESSGCETQSKLFSDNQKIDENVWGKKRQESIISKTDHSSKETLESLTATFIYSKYIANEQLLKERPVNMTNCDSKVQSNKGKLFKLPLCNNKSAKLPLIHRIRTTVSSNLTQNYGNVKRLSNRVLPEVIVS